MAIDHTYVEVRSLAENTSGGEVLWVSYADAEFFSVYIGRPGEYEWHCDFADPLDALRWASDRALFIGATLINRMEEIT